MYPANADPPVPDAAGEAKGAAAAFMPGVLTAIRRAPAVVGAAGGLEGDALDSAFDVPVDPLDSLPSCARPCSRYSLSATMTGTFTSLHLSIFTPGSMLQPGRDQLTYYKLLY